MTVAPERPTLAQLERWLPPDAVVDIVAERSRRKPGEWCAEIPAFRISEHGCSRDEAVANARCELVSYFTDAAREGKTYEQALAARKSLLQMFAFVFLMVLVFKTARDKDASWWRVPGEMLVVEDWEAARETIEILEDEATMNALRESDADVAAGRVRPYEDARRDLGLG